MQGLGRCHDENRAWTSSVQRAKMTAITGDEMSRAGGYGCREDRGVCGRQTELFGPTQKARISLRNLFDSDQKRVQIR